MNVEDMSVQNRRLWVRLREKGGKRHKMPCHHNLVTDLHAYLDGGGIAADPRGAVSHYRAHDEVTLDFPFGCNLARQS
jgi:hypothetical protein